MPIFCRILFLFIVSTSLTVTCYSQIIEKAPSSPVTVTPIPPDSVNSLVEVSDIILTGFKKTKSYIIQREVPFKKGEVLLYHDLLEKLNLSKQRLMNTALFVDVDVIPIRLDSSHVYININVKERWYLFPIPYFRIMSRNFNQWWVEEKRSLDRIDYGLKFMQNNVTGRNDHLNLWFINGYTQQISLRYDNPNIDNKLKHGINVGFGFSRNRELNYKIDSNKQKFDKFENRFLIKRTYVDFAYIYRPAIKTRHIFRVGYSDLSVDERVAQLNPQFIGKGLTRIKYPDLSYTLSYYNLDYNPYPLKGFAGEASFYKRFGLNSNIWQLSASGNYATKLLPATYLQLQGIGSVRLPFNQPYIANGLMGSSSFYMRGLEYYVIEGVAGGILRGTLKQQLLSFNVRSPIKSRTHDKIPFRLFVKTFGDLGYAYTPNFGNSRLNNKTLFTGGFGLDIVTFYDIVVRLEYSFNQLGDSGLFVHTQSDF